MTLRTRIINRRYRLERRIGLSDTTETWLGFDNVLHRAVGITVPRQEVLRDTPFLAEFLQRSQIATALHHRGIIAAFDSGEDSGTPYLVTEFLGGEPLAEIIRAEAPFDVDDVAILVEQIANALDYAHQRGFVHGSLSPSEIVVDGQGAAKVLGLGLPTGTVRWSTDSGPEAPLTFDDDVRALAAIAFEMLTGEAPNSVDPDFSGPAYVIQPDVPRNASDIVEIGLGAGPMRFSSAGSFARQLSDWREYEPIDYPVIPAPSVPLVEKPIQAYAVTRAPLPAPPDGDLRLAIEEPSGERAPEGASSTRGVRLALAAALLLGLVAIVLIWRNSEAIAGIQPQPPSQIESLAEISGF